jgi:hypothetical protein
MANSTHARHAPQTSSEINPALGCPRFERCNCGFCPALGGAHLKDEPVCAWLREAVKPGGRAILEGALPGNLAEVVLGIAPSLLRARTALGRALRKAATGTSKVQSGQRLQAARVHS